MAKQVFNTLQQYRAPAWTELLKYKPNKRLVLCMSPTPIHRWNIPGVPEDFQLFIKRDDLTGSTLTGNKARKLEFLFADVLERGCDCVVTSGGFQSNHCRAAALVAAQCGMEAHLMTFPMKNSATPQDSSAVEYCGNLLLSGLAGANIVLLSLDKYKAAANHFQFLEDCIASYSQELSKRGKKPYIIPPGGASPVGEWGYISAFDEMIQQGVLDQFDDIVVAGGTISTAFGLAISNYLTGSKLKVHAFTVNHSADILYAQVDKLLSESVLDERLSKAKVSELTARNLLHIIEGYAGLKYDMSTDEELAMLTNIASTTGVVLDPNYGIKAVHGMISEMNKTPAQFKGKRVLFIHTGGVFTVFDGRVLRSLPKEKISKYEDFFH